MIVAGAGVAGSYLYNVLDDVTIVDKNPGNRGCDCAWGTHPEIQEYLDEINIDIEPYIINKINTVVINGIEIDLDEPQYIIDKPRLLKAMVPNSKVTKKKVDIGNTDEDIINATGSPINKGYYLETTQYRTRIMDTELDDGKAYIYATAHGYGWIFPLELNNFHVGAGTYKGKTKQLLRETQTYYNVPDTTQCHCESSINITPPQLQEIYDDNVISVGEAAGTTSPVTGEGIIPALKSAQILAEHIDKNGIDKDGYRTDLCQEFEGNTDAYKAVTNGSKSMVIEAVLKNMKINLSTMTKVKIAKKVLGGFL